MKWMGLAHRADGHTGKCHSTEEGKGCQFLQQCKAKGLVRCYSCGTAGLGSLSQGANSSLEGFTCRSCFMLRHLIMWQFRLHGHYKDRQSAVPCRRSLTAEQRRELFFWEGKKTTNELLTSSLQHLVLVRAITRWGITLLHCCLHSGLLCSDPTELWTDTALSLTASECDIPGGQRAPWDQPFKSGWRQTSL